MKDSLAVAALFAALLCIGLEGLTQIAFSPAESRLHVVDAKDGEMSEWLKEHAWK